MGKKIILKGANFSENGLAKITRWYTDGYTITVGAGMANPVVPNLANGGWGYNTGSLFAESLQGKTINKLKAYAVKLGTFNIYLAKGLSSDYAATKKLVCALQITSIGTFEVDFPAVLVGDDETLVFGDGDAAQGSIGFYTSSNTPSTTIRAKYGTFYGKCLNASSPSGISQGGIPVDIGYEGYE